MRGTLSLAILALIFLFACKSSSDDKPAATPPQVKEAPKGNHELPAMDKATFDNLRSTVTQVDYIFHFLPFSMNQTDPNAVQSNLALISPEQADDLSGCQPFARETFQSNGTIVMEADLYFSEGCIAYVFYKGKEAVYANKVTPDGINFYRNMINNVRTQANQQRQGG